MVDTPNVSSSPAASTGAAAPRRHQSGDEIDIIIEVPYKLIVPQVRILQPECQEKKSFFSEIPARTWAIVVAILIGSLIIFSRLESPAPAVPPVRVEGPAPTPSVTPASNRCKEPLEETSIRATMSGSDTVRVGEGCPWRVDPVKKVRYCTKTFNKYMEQTSRVCTHETYVDNPAIVRYVTVFLEEPDTVRFSVIRQ